MDSDDEETQEAAKAPKFPIQMYISEGNKYLRLAKYETAIEFYNTALEREPNNAKCLLGRARCQIRLGKVSEAKDDALTALGVNPRSCDAKMLIGEADYFLGDFEKAFLTFYRGHERRNNHEGLRVGHQMCRRAIENALQPDTPMAIDDQDVTDLAKLEDNLNQDQPVEKVGKDQYTSDVNFVNSILEDDDFANVHPHCSFLKSFIRDRQVFWRTQNPSTSKRSREDPAIIDKKGKAEDDPRMAKPAGPPAGKPGEISSPKATIKGMEEEAKSEEMGKEGDSEEIEKVKIEKTDEEKAEEPKKEELGPGTKASQEMTSGELEVEEAVAKESESGETRRKEDLDEVEKVKTEKTNEVKAGKESKTRIDLMYERISQEMISEKMKKKDAKRESKSEKFDEDFVSEETRNEATKKENEIESDDETTAEEVSKNESAEAISDGSDVEDEEIVED